MADGGVTGNEEAAIGWAATQLVHCAAMLNDACRWEELTALFAEDAVYGRPSNPDDVIVGRTAILASLQARPARATRHILSNVLVDIRSPVSVRATSYATLFAGAPSDGIVDADPVIAIGTFVDEICKFDGRWLFVRRTGSITMRHSGRSS